MGNGNENSKPPPSSEELYEEIEKRKDWFFECLLRGLNIFSFRGVEENDPRTAYLLPLISELSDVPPLGSKLNKDIRVYHDSKQPVWTRAGREQRDAFGDISNGKGPGNWLNYMTPVILGERLAQLKKLYDASKFSSNMDDLQELNNYPRKDPSLNNKETPSDPPKDSSDLAHAISRVAITEKKPWLIPEIFNSPNFDTSAPEQWIKNGEVFISNFEFEINELLGGGEGFQGKFNLADTDPYRNWVKDILQKSINLKKANALRIEFLDKSSSQWQFNIKLGTPAYPFADLATYPHSDSVKYWINSCNNALKEVYVLKSGSDMGLCLVVRALYLYGTIPANVGAGAAKELRWRNRKHPDSTFNDFFIQKAGLKKDNAVLLDRLHVVQKKLQILLEETADSPHSGAIHFSPLAQEIIKKDILGYKFWMDESFSAYHNNGKPADDKNLSDINKAKTDTKTEDAFAEMEYWSENHYIMFASSEYLAGQLWQDETFEAAKDFINPPVPLFEGNSADELTPYLFADTTDQITGKKRIERGKARSLKWLNNKLMFGWTEFNSSGYYREHLWSLLNLVDFALDEEVQRKATVVTDLLLFDVTRFLHKGSMGACGGRSQFPSRNNGWDNAPSDAFEIMLATHGIFHANDGEIGCSFATSTYKPPAVLLEIGNLPPEVSFVDRSRVSIGFDDAPKYGIQYSQKSDQKDSLEQGFRPKKDKHFSALQKVNSAIENNHNGYGAMEDDTVFWWTQSAFFNKQVVRNSCNCIIKFKLYKAEFAQIGELLNVLQFFISDAELLLGGLPVVGPMFLNDAFSDALENASDDFSVFLEGSTRSRINIHTYRNRDVMLSSVQNFRTGQLNIQSNINQATISKETNVFTTAGFPGLSISDLPFTIGGALVGALGVYTLGIGAAAGAVAGGIAGAAINEILIDGSNPFGKQGDGPGWWTGYWALPMVVQHENAAVLIYDFNWIQRRLTDVGSHVWFPKNGFDTNQVEERRTSAYDDENSVLFDAFTGKKGFWVFGKKTHKTDPLNPDANEEGYIGVFSNQRPEWQDSNSDFYSDQMEENIDKVEKKIEENNAKIKEEIDKTKVEELLKENENLQSTWLSWANLITVDFFADKDWYAEDKNIWIIQVGNKKEYGSFENFKNRVSSAKVEVDDIGDLECIYHIPRPDGSSQALSLKYKDEIKLNGNDFQSDFYPRFENPFIRGGRVEWGQREYVIEYNGKFLMHDFSDMEHPVRAENDKPSIEDIQTVKGLVIYLKTEDQEMEIFSVAMASVNIGCNAVATNEVIAAGEVNENNFHDAEWIFFDMSSPSDPDMTIDIYHNLLRNIPYNNDSDTEWKMTFTLKALMGDRSLKPCTMRFAPLSKHYFRQGSRNTGPIPFSVQLLQWRKWKKIDDTSRMKHWMIAGQPGNIFFYFNYADQLGIDKENILWHRKLGSCDAVSSWTDLNSNDDEPALAQPFSFFSFSTQPGYLFLFLISRGFLYARWLVPGQSWSSQPWTKLNISYQPKKILLPGNTVPPPLPVPLWPLSFVYATFINSSVTTPAVYVSGMEGNIYVSFKWPLDGQGYWRKIETASVFNLLHTITFRVAGNFLFAVDVKRSLWQYAVPDKEEIIPGLWEQLPATPFMLESFVAAAFNEVLQLIACSTEGTIWAIRLDAGLGSAIWQRIGQNINFKASDGAQVSYASPVQGRLDIFIAGIDDKIYSTWWTEASGWENDHNWAVVAEDSQQFKASESGNIAAISRVNGQVEIYATDSDENIWKNWWS